MTNFPLRWAGQDAREAKRAEAHALYLLEHEGDVDDDGARWWARIAEGAWVRSLRWILTAVKMEGE